MFKSRAKRLFARHKRHQQQLIEQQQQQQSAMKQQYFDSKRCHRTYSCAHCRAHLADHDQLVSKLFQGNHGRAYLFNKVINIGCKQAIQRELLTGLHAVADIYCDSCETTVGWKYEQAFVASQKYKEGKYIIESIHMLKENNWDLTSYNARELIRRDATRLDELADLCAASFCLNDDVADDNQAIKGQLPSNGLRPGEPAASEAIGAAAADAAANRCDDISGMDSRQLHDAAIDDGDDDDADADADAAAAANRTSSSCSVVIMRQPTDTTPQRTANGGSAAHLGDDSTTLSAGEHFGDNRRRPEIDGQHEMAAKASDPSELITIRVDQTTRAKRR